MVKNEISNLVELYRFGFTIFIVILCFINLFSGLKKISEIDDIVKKKQSGGGIGRRILTRKAAEM